MGLFSVFRRSQLVVEKWKKNMKKKMKKKPNKFNLVFATELTKIVFKLIILVKKLYTRSIIYFILCNVIKKKKI